MVEAVLIDIDGTLMDNTALHVLAWQRAFRQVGREIDVATLTNKVGMGSDKLVPDVLGPDAPEEDLERVREAHSEEYLEKGLADHAEPTPGALELLRELKRRGLRVALATSAKEAEVERYLPHLDGARDTDVMLTSGDVSGTKPDPDIFSTSLEKLGNPGSAVAIGDTTWDVESAAKVGLPCICVLSGGIERERLVEAGAVAVYANPADLLANIEEVLNPPPVEELALGIS